MTPPLDIYLDLDPELAHELFTASALQRLEGCGRVTYRRPGSEGRLECDVLVTGWGSAPLPQPLPPHGRVRLVVHSAGTIRRLVGKEMLAHLRVSQASAGMAVSVAELATAFTLSLLRDLPRTEALWRSGRDWSATLARPLARTVAGSTVGVLGASRVGRAYIRTMAAMGADVLVNDPYVPEHEISALGGRGVDLQGLLRRSDVVALHVPVTSETLGMIGRHELSLIRDGGIVINTGRAALVDSGALLAELSSGRLSAGLDVFDTEPLPADDPLWSLPNVLITPHVGARTTHSRRSQGDLVADEVVAFATGVPLQHEVRVGTYDLVA